MEVRLCPHSAAAGDALCRDDPGGGGGAAGGPAYLRPHAGTPPQEPGLQRGAVTSTGGAWWTLFFWYETSHSSFLCMLIDWKLVLQSSKCFFSNHNFCTSFTIFFSHLHIIDDPVLGQLIESLPPLHPCELLDPADDQTLPRLIEVLEQRHRIRQTITDQVNRTGTGLSLLASI